MRVKGRLRWGFNLSIGWRALGAAAVGAAVAAGAAAPRGPAPARKAPATPIVWTDLDGRGYGPLQLRAAPATVFLFFSTECPVANAYVPRIRELEDRYYAKGVRFFLVSSHPADTVERMRAYAAERKLVLPLVKDSGAAL